MNDTPRTVWLKYTVLWVGLAILYAGLRSFTFFSELVHDDGLFLYTGQAWASGELPYRDFSDHKPPGLFFLLSIPCRLFPFSLFAVKAFLILWAALGAVLLYHLCRQFTGRVSSILTLLLYVFFTSQFTTIRTGGLTEEGALPFVIASFLFLLNHNHWRWAFASGLMMGAAIQFRQTFVFTALFHFVWIAQLFFYKKQSAKTCLAQLLTLGGGMLAPECLVSLYFGINGGWWAYIENSYLFNFIYVSASPSNTWQDILNHHWSFIKSTGPYLFAPLFALALIPWADQSKRMFLLPLLACIVGDMIAISLSGEYYTHYYVQAAVCIHLLFTLTFSCIFNPNNLKKTKATRFLFWPVSIITILAMIVMFYFGVNSYIRDYRSVLRDYNNPNRAYAFQRGVANAARSITDAEDKILLIGQAPNSVYFLSGRYAGSRYYHYSPLWKEKFQSDQNRRFFDEFNSDLQLRRPVVLIMDLTVMNSDEPLDWIESFNTDTATIIRESYSPLIDHFEDVIPEDDWFWHDINVSFWVRNDQIEKVGQRLTSLSSL